MESRIKLAPPRYFPLRANSLAVGVHPQTNQQLRINRWSPAFFRATLDTLVEMTQIHTPDKRPDRPRWMVFTDQPLHINGPPAHLLAVHVADQRLLAGDIFFTHAASLRQPSYFARLKFRGFLHSFKSKRERGGHPP